MKRMPFVLAVCLAVAAFAEDRPLVTITGKLTAAAGVKPPLEASMSLSPTQGSTALELKPGGAFVLAATASRTYQLRVYARGFAAFEKTVELDEHGRADLGNVTLEPLRTLSASVVVGHRSKLAEHRVQHLELKDSSCAVVRADDESGCTLRFCTAQRGAVLTTWQRGEGARFRGAGKVELAAALAGTTRGSAVVSTDDGALPLLAGHTWFLEFDDPFCAGALHVDAEVVAR